METEKKEASQKSGWVEIEKERVRKRREALGLNSPDGFGNEPWGLALSGGSIRSATFALGVLQALAKAKLLSRFDYLSTVSGGGYLGSLFTSLFEGPTAVLSAEADPAAPTRVAVEMTYVGQGDARWRDHALMRCENAQWRVDDVEFGGDWDFASDGHLRDALDAE